MDISEAGGSPASFSINRGHMISISSTDNNIIKEAAKLATKKHRDLQACYIVEGPNVIREAMAQKIKLQHLFFVESTALPSSRLAELDGLKRQVDQIRVKAYEVSAEAFSKIVQTDTSQGVLAIAEKKVFTEKEFFRNKEGNVLVLDRVQDPGNVGTLLRTAEAAGLSGALLLKGCGDVYAPKTVRAAAGTLFRLPLLFAENPAEAITLLHKYNKTIYVAAAQAETYYFDCPLRENAAIVIGNEGNGAAEEWIQKADRLIKIPMEGQAESLNAALAGGIIMYEVRRQRMSD